MRAAILSARAVSVSLRAESPQNNHSRKELNEAVAAESEESRTSRVPHCRKGYCSLKGHPSDGQIRMVASIHTQILLFLQVPDNLQPAELRK
jgi:hypothetical protein